MDKLLIGVLFVAYIGWLFLIDLDVERFQWSSVPRPLRVIGAILIGVTLFIRWLVIREEERGHKVVTTGPYSFVRHPMYVGTIPFLIGMPLLLGSFWGVLFSPVLLAVLGLRAILEERTLIAEHEGYAEYTNRVRYRFMPHIW
jgi:protein-S-isoprenylcysteine O-methyltransferase Ste14